MKKRYSVGPNTVWEQVFRKLLIKSTLITLQMANFIWESLVPLPLSTCTKFFMPWATQFQLISIGWLRSKAVLNTDFFDEAQFIQNGLTSCHNAHIWYSNILQLSTCLSFSVNMLCCFISSHLIWFAFPTRWATTHLEDSPGHRKHVVAK
jgi:hypothetical protein